MMKKKLALLAILLTFMALTIGLSLFVQQKLHPTSGVQAITREGVISEIQKLNRLNTVAFGVDTVITAQKDGTWYKLWQDEQKGLFVAQGRVLAGVDLAKLTADKVSITYPPDDKTAKPTIEIVLPASEVFEVYLDNIQVYDWQTGLFGIVDNDPEILNQAQLQGKSEVLKKACEGNIMQIALDNAKEQVAGLFALTGAVVSVQAQQVGACKL